jgi:hypothetical protein
MYRPGCYHLADAMGNSHRSRGKQAGVVGTRELRRGGGVEATGGSSSPVNDIMWELWGSNRHDRIPPLRHEQHPELKLDG